ncbi:MULTISPECIES: ATP-grasp peptide maturase system methyltransferase [Streptomyces]|uniref:ATP-grasp peptide maturase system methyltransferase n=1 Tax=Streptomyces TaxID=1883 RepID=UPI000F76BA5A|nr:ATP-grasp peptide maturase system methyltransferase [Streptomyces sp. WAC05858]RSS44173.1 methyltransferase [Streptomyces sp. WAC05858]WTA81977.1 ATP-grasp peptide maturase system methyltransferase [Streptomyces antimycoticus]WTB07551.1 ATP-grasp peptide maturase system methyltransferase [Streptomyces antimycoticus]
MMPDTASDRRALADRLQESGVLTHPEWRAAVEAVPRELFLQPGVFLPTDVGRWLPVTAFGTGPKEWSEIAYRDESLVTQLDGHLTADRTAEPVPGVPTSSSTTPVTVVGMVEALDVEDGHTALEIGTGTGYSTALMCHRLGEDNVTTIEVDPGVAARADAALEAAGYSTWTVTGDGLLGHPRRAPYDRVIATCAVRRIPHTWVRQTKPGGTILTTLAPGSWAYGTGLAKVTVNEDGTAEGRIIGESSFMQARSQTVVPLAGDLSARTAYTDSERAAKVPPALLEEWMPAFLAQLAAPGAQLVHATRGDGHRQLYVFDADRESFAAFTENGSGWTVRQGGPVALWDDIQRALIAWHDAGRPDVSAMRLRITPRSHMYWIDGSPALRWEHRLT